MAQPSMTAPDFVWLVGGICQLEGLPFEAESFLRQTLPPHDRDSLCRVLDGLGLRGEALQPTVAGVAQVSAPFVGFLLPGEAQSQADTPQTPALIVRNDGERLVYVRAGCANPEIVACGEYERIFLPDAIAVRQLAPRLTADDAKLAAAATVRFGFRWFIPELLKHKAVWRDVLLASALIQILGLGIPIFTQIIIDKVVVHHTKSTLAVVATGIALFTIFAAMMGWLRQYLVIHTGMRVDSVLSLQVLRHLFRLPLAYFEHRPTGTLVARLHGVETIREFLSGSAVALLLDLPFLIVFLAVMFAYSWQLTLIALAMLVLLAGGSVAVTPLLRRRLDRQFLMGARTQAFVTEYVSGVETVKSLQMEPQVERRYSALMADYLSSAFDTRRLANSYQTGANLLEQVQSLAILSVGAMLVMRNDGFTVGMLVAFQMFASRMSQPVMRMAGLYQEFQQAAIAVKRLGDVMDCQAEPYAAVPARGGRAAGQIEMEAVAFRYGPKTPFLYRDFNLTVRVGQLVALSGPSGSGKSTLAKLLQGFYWPEDGRIRIDGIDTRHLAANELRQCFGVVPQETILFSGTIYDNLIAGNPHASFEDVVTACKMAEIHSTIEQLPEGYRTEIGERGVGLSGGQRQRIAIARALLKRPRILVFDEATSGLDPHTAEQFAHTINRLKGRVTILFIAHYLPRSLAADEQVRLDAMTGGEAAAEREAS